ncbi:TRMT1-like protein isoform X3 [Nerophis lumbriciformis]|uniref:TRMT1-like protein isoform X3 n=1 Tax=Nerophis lumbriciformis TaxID=546530 RepID=UPI002ADFCC0D|nr:TRMT1-like protein isoform X3 [Nerophis lumbriciformis]
MSFIVHNVFYHNNNMTANCLLLLLDYVCMCARAPCAYVLRRPEADGERVPSTDDASDKAAKNEADSDAKPSTTTDRHISIQTKLEDLEMLVDLNGAGRKSCPLCPEEKFKACYNHKLRRHLHNLHWKVYVEFEGQKMCICHLPCRNPKPSLSGEQVSGRHVAHYHCVVCSVTIARKTDMVSHLKRHINKGETKSSYPGSSDVLLEEPASSGQVYEIMKELDTNVQLLPMYNTPQKSDTYFNRKMKSNRQLVFCSLAALAKERNRLECLDAFGATGIAGLQWAKHLHNAVKVTITDISEICVKMIKENCQLNQIQVDRGSEGPECCEDAPGEVEGEAVTAVEVVKMDANVMMHLRAFDYIHLDPFGTAVNYLDAAFRNVRNMGIVSVTSTDTGSLYAKSPNVTLRHYSTHIVRTEYYKELAARIVLATVARAAARCNKGIDVLLAVALEHFVLVVVRVLRGPTQADESAKKLRKLVHCQWCEDRIFLKQGNLVDGTLPCNCHGSLPGKTAVQLGPLWSGALFNTGFLRKMLLAATQHSMDNIQTLVKTLICESECTTLKPVIHGAPALVNQVECGVIIRTSQSEEEACPADSSGKRKAGEELSNAVKKLKSDVSLEHPPFYYSIHRHSMRGMNMPKLNKFLQYLREAGFRVSRTHFDPTGVRTDATLEEFKSVLSKYSIPSCPSQVCAAQASVSQDSTM